MRFVLPLLLLSCGTESPAPVEKEAAPAPTKTTSLKTSKPSEATRQLLKRVGDVKVVAFYPAGEVRDQVHGYFTELGLPVEELDQAAEPKRAHQLGARDNGVIVLVLEQDGRTAVVHVNAGPRAAKELAELDRRVSGALMKLLPPKKGVIYGTGSGRDFERLLAAARVSAKMRALDDGAALPEATKVVVYMDDGRRPTGAALEKVAAFARDGGAVMLALEPKADPGIEALLGTLGVKLDPTLVASESSHVVVAKNTSDRFNVTTKELSDHPAVATVAKNGQPLAFFGSGSVEGGVPLVSTGADAFRDVNGDATQDAKDPPGPFALAVAVDEEGKGRAVVYADATWLDSKAFRRMPAYQFLLAEAVAWLAGIDATAPPPPAAPELTTYPLR